MTRLACPGCGASVEDDGTRFCARCGMPLVFGDLTVEAELTPAQERARKVKKQYLDGPLVRVASARHQAEAELIQGLLLEEGVPSLVKRNGGFDVPDMMFSGPRDILVPASGSDVAREVLRLPAPDPQPSARRPLPRSTRGARVRIAGLLAVLVLALGGLTPLVFWLLH